MSEHVADLTDDSFATAIAEAEGMPVLVDFWAEWCVPCKAIAPLLEEIAVENPGKVKIAKINIDEFQSASMKYQVMSLPTMLLFENGEVTKRITGGKSKNQIMEEIGL